MSVFILERTLSVGTQGIPRIQTLHPHIALQTANALGPKFLQKDTKTHTQAYSKLKFFKRFRFDLCAAPIISSCKVDSRSISSPQDIHLMLSVNILNLCINVSI